MGTREQRNTGHGHHDKGTGQHTNDCLQINPRSLLSEWRSSNTYQDNHYEIAIKYKYYFPGVSVLFPPAFPWQIFSLTHMPSKGGFTIMIHDFCSHYQGCLLPI